MGWSWRCLRERRKQHHLRNRTRGWSSSGWKINDSNCPTGDPFLFEQVRNSKPGPICFVAVVSEGDEHTDHRRIGDQSKNRNVPWLMLRFFEGASLTPPQTIERTLSTRTRPNEEEQMKGHQMNDAATT